MTLGAERGQRTGRVARWRSPLFTPANRPDLIAKQARFGADLVIVDLEDGTPLGAKADGRAGATAAIPKLRAEYAGAVVLRVNGVTDAANFGPDLDCAAGVGADGVVVPKIESVDDVDRLADALRSRGLGDVAVVYGLESVAGVHRAADVLTHAAGTARVDAAYFGAEDFIADLGGRRTRSNAEVLYARSQVAIACRLAGVVALDQVTTAISDRDRFLEEAAQARDLGYGGKMCIHPGQVALAHEAFTPSPEEYDRARRLVEAYEQAQREGRGTLNFEGGMVDIPLVLQARRVLAAGG
ncbi:CoA ester lyase [Frankia sp. CNm7]|uniref:CoA ester lyase n=1 Tax=Frankia nepalensis TaxID=1836974 RepID=A0A937RW91_9ACTN|nr:CoA ester lyase [Frankia nepalensis]MBL7495011.1 CoA ester lyase [Frankia nepalensis]MBL7513677.1 CoA ester lyase [Frankia nepalensis]MBL7524592.1 CoA ester lyase [Frankia nepalensis]MBL7632996.1 CoA ester lyase [Frankia nepalensis]